MNSTTKIIAGVAVLALLFAGIGYALDYKGTVTNENNSATAEYLSVGLPSYSQYLSGTYYFDTVNSTGTYTWGDVNTTSGAVTAETGMAFTVANNKFEYKASAPESGDYKAYKINEIVATVDLAKSTQKDFTFKMTDNADGEVPVTNLNGISLVFTYSYGTTPTIGILDGTGASIDNADDATSCPITVTAYLVVKNDGSTTAPDATITLGTTTLKFVATATAAAATPADPDPNPEP